MTLPSGAVTSYRYDPLGRRIETIRGGQSRVQVYGLDPNAVAESTGGGASTRYTFGVGYDTPLAMRRGTATTFFAQDALSSVTSLMDQAGAVTGRYRYDTYGQIAGTSGTADSPYTYTGREWDEGAGIYDYRARAYDPATGRFLSEDALAAANLYGYADGVPTAITDPSGRITSADTTGAMIVQQALIGANANLAIRILRCGGGSPKQIRNTVGGGLLAGGVFGGIGWKVAKLIAKKVAQSSASTLDAAFAVGMFSLVYGWFTSVPNHFLSNVSTDVDLEDPLGWMITPLGQGISGGLPDPPLIGAGIDGVLAVGGQLLPWLMSDDTKEDCAE